MQLVFPSYQAPGYYLGMLKARPQRVAFPDIPIPFTPVMEQWALPSAEKIVAAYQNLKNEE